MNAPKKSDPLAGLIPLVEDLIAKEPHETSGLLWAAQPQEFYCEKFGVSVRTLRRRIGKPPFARRRVLIDGKIVTLLRLGEAPPKDVADEAKRVMITIWNKAQGKPATRKEGQCLWGMTGDIMKILAEFNLTAKLSLPAELGGELAIAMFKYAISKQGWPTVATVVKGWAKELPDGKVRYYNHPSITVIRLFVMLALRAYLEAASSGEAKCPDGCEELASLEFGTLGGKLAAFLYELICLKMEMEEAGEEASEAT